MKGVPARPMQIILAAFVKTNNIPLRVNRPEEFIRAFKLFCKHINGLHE